MSSHIQTDNPRSRGWEHTLFQAADKISLSPALYDTINKRYNTLQGILRASDDPILKNVHVFHQGSIRLRTAINPHGRSGELGTVDADAVVWLENAGNASAEEVLHAIERRFKDGVRVEAPVTPLRRGIRIIYADENPGFHIDITPARNTTFNSSTLGHGRLVVPDRDLKEWKASAPIDYCTWLERVAAMSLPISERMVLSEEALVYDDVSQEEMPSYAAYADGNVLRAAIKLLKRNRDIWADENPDLCKFRPISALITTLAGRSYEDIAQDRSFHFRRPLDALLAVVRTMPDFIGGSPGNWKVNNPADGEENFAEKWNRSDGQKYHDAFFSWHEHALRSFQIGLHEQVSMEHYHEEVSRAFGVERSFLDDVTGRMPNNWDLPGRADGITRSSLALSALSGRSVAGNGKQSDLDPVDRLG